MVQPATTGVERALQLVADGKLFAGDGGGPTSVAAPGNGQWIYLFRPEMVGDRTDGQLPNAKELVRPGVFRAERLVNLAKHNYSWSRTSPLRPT